MSKRNYFVYIFISVILFWTLWIGLYWLAVLILLLILVYLGILKLVLIIPNTKKVLKKSLKGGIVLLFIVSISIGFKVLVFDIYKIPSSSMEGTLQIGDVILVNKLKYGPRLPRSPMEIPWVNILYYLSGNNETLNSKTDWTYKRLPGCVNIRNGDVIVFDMFNDNMVIVKRCMGIAGDTLKIVNGEVLINGNVFNPTKNVENNYNFKTVGSISLQKKLDSLKAPSNLKRINKNWFEATLSIQEKNILVNEGLVDSVKIILDTAKTRFPKSEILHWTLDNYGPYVVPKKGMTINLNQINFDLYNKAINDHENAYIEQRNNRYYLDGKEIKAYTFKHDYYFMMGDNRKGSQDSRYWGLVPENRIIGKVQCVLFSNSRDRFQWERLFKKVY